MKLKLALSALALTLVPALSMACPMHEKQAMSCADGMTYDTASGTCISQVTG